METIKPERLKDLPEVTQLVRRRRRVRRKVEDIPGTPQAPEVREAQQEGLGSEAVQRGKNCQRLPEVSLLLPCLLQSSLHVLAAVSPCCTAGGAMASSGCSCVACPVLVSSLLCSLPSCLNPAPKPRMVALAGWHHSQAFVLLSTLFLYSSGQGMGTKQGPLLSVITFSKSGAF